jgi:hypothetical protein
MIRLIRLRPNFFSSTVRILVVLGGILLTLATPSLGDDDGPFQPFIEKYPEGWIDWDAGIIYGVGKGYLHLNGNSSNRAQRAAQVLALQAILKMAAGIRLDDRQTLEKLGDGKVVIYLKGFIRFTEHQSTFKDQAPHPYHEITLRAPLTGIDGLTSKLLRHLESKPETWQDFPVRTVRPKDESDDQTWLVLDARPTAASAHVQPALFPKITTPSGNVIYELKNVDEEAVVARGMARYVLSEQTADKLQTSGTGWDALLGQVDALLSLREAHAEDKPKRQKRRRYIVKQVQEAQGLMRTNLVISENDARQLEEEDASSQILKKCRVIVIAASPIGGIEGRAMRYFASIPSP